MTDKISLWQKITDAERAIVQHLIPAVREALQESIFSDVPAWGFLGTPHYNPEQPLTVEHIQQRQPYTNPEFLAQHLQSLQDADFLDADFVITQTAYDAYQVLVDAQDAAAAAMTNPESDKLNAAIAYLERVDTSAQELDAPSLQSMLTLDLPTPATHRFYELVGRLRALRDDVHLQAWHPLDVDAHSFEVLSLVWDGTASTPEAFVEARQFRGYSVETVQTTFDNLVTKGWLTQEQDNYHLTETAQQIRDAVEQKTDTLFYRPFDVLSQDEQTDFAQLLEHIAATYATEQATT